LLDFDGTLATFSPDPGSVYLNDEVCSLLGSFRFDRSSPSASPAIPGTLATAYLALQLYEKGFEHVVVPSHARVR